MSTIIDRPAALVASPRPRLLSGSRDLTVAGCLTGARAADLQPRLMERLPMTAAGAWRHEDASSKRAFDVDGHDTKHNTKAGRTVDFGGAYGTTVTTQQHSIRSGPPTRRP